jgi:hypothetical protein
LEKLLAIGTAKSKVSEFFSPDSENFSQGDAQSQTMSFSVRPNNRRLLTTGLNENGAE